MCQAVVVLNGQEILRDVVRVELLPEGVRLSVLFEQPQIVSATIREIDLLKHRVILDPMVEGET